MTAPVIIESNSFAVVARFYQPQPLLITLFHPASRYLDWTITSHYRWGLVAFRSLAQAPGKTVSRCLWASYSAQELLDLVSRAGSHRICRQACIAAAQAIHAWTPTLFDFKAAAPITYRLKSFSPPSSSLSPPDPSRIGPISFSIGSNSCWLPRSWAWLARPRRFSPQACPAAPSCFSNTSQAIAENILTH